MLRVAVIVAFIWPMVVSASNDPRCAGRGTVVLIHTDDHEMLLCSKGTVAHEYSISLGREGVGKRKQGDLKTPLGTYSLSTPRVSKKFGLFIPIGYPTREQKRAGFTGGDVGIHGPARNFAWARGLNTLVDWTQGCIAVGSDAAMKEVAAWVKKERPLRIDIEQ